MSLSRGKTLPTSLLLALLLSVGAVFQVFAVDSVVKPETAHKFTPLHSSEISSIEVDRTSMTRITKRDGDTLSGAVFRITLVKPIDIGSKEAYTFVQAVIGVCGYDGIVMMRSTAYDKKGVEVGTTDRARAFPDPKQADAAATVAYKLLCTGVPKGIKQGGALQV
jgi:hypothetical protein